MGRKPSAKLSRCATNRHARCLCVLPVVVSCSNVTEGQYKGAMYAVSSGKLFKLDNTATVVGGTGATSAC